MREIKRIETNIKPESIQLLGNGYYYYNYDIKPCKIIVNDLDTNLSKTEDGWSYIPVYIYGNPSYNEVVKHIIRLYITLDEEFDLINSYNKSIITNVIDEKSKNDYSKYLLLLDNIKNEVKQSFKTI